MPESTDIMLHCKGSKDFTKLGAIQRRCLEEMMSHGGLGGRGSGWMWDTTSGTDKLLVSLAKWGSILRVPSGVEDDEMTVRVSQDKPGQFFLEELVGTHWVPTGHWNTDDYIETEEDTDTEEAETETPNRRRSLPASHLEWDVTLRHGGREGQLEKTELSYIEALQTVTEWLADNAFDVESVGADRWRFRTSYTDPRSEIQITRYEVTED